MLGEVWNPVPSRFRDSGPQFLHVWMAKVETTQIPIAWWVNKQNVVYSCGRILFDHRKEWNTNTCHSLDEPWIQYAVWNRPDIKGCVLCDLHEMFRIGKSIETESRLGVGCQELGEGGSRKVAANMCVGFSIWSKENVLELDIGNGCTILWLY